MQFISRCIFFLIFFESINAFNIVAPTRFSQQRNLEMKGKGGRVPINQRGEFLKRQRMIEQQNSMKTADEKKDGSVPVFQVYTRPKVGGLWIPVGDLQVHIAYEQE